MTDLTMGQLVQQWIRRPLFHSHVALINNRQFRSGSVRPWFLYIVNQSTTSDCLYLHISIYFPLAKDLVHTTIGCGK